MRRTKGETNIKTLVGAIRIIREIVRVLYFWAGYVAIFQEKNIPEEEATIDRLYVQCEGYLRDHDMLHAYERMSPSFQADHTHERVIQRFHDVQEANDAFRLLPQRT